MSNAPHNGQDPNGAVADFATIAGTELPHQTQLLQQLAEGNPERQYLEDQVTISWNKTDPISYVWRPAIPAVGEIYIEAWHCAEDNTVIPQLIVDGSYPGIDGSTYTVGDGHVDAMMCIPGGGVAKICRQGFSGFLTVIPLSAVGVAAFTTVRVRACEKP